MKPRWKKYFPYAAILVIAGGLLFILVETVRARTTGFETKTLWDWMELLIVPLVLAIAAFYLNRSEREGERQRTEQRLTSEREIATERYQEAALQSYLDRMADLLLKEKLRTTESQEARNVAAIRTLTLLRGIDVARKGLVLRFLVEAGLISQKYLLDVAGADLQGADLQSASLKDANLQGANLRGANLRNAWLYEINLQHANLQDANLEYAKLYNTTLIYANLQNANLQGADLQNSDLRDVHLKGANLRHANFQHANLQGVDLEGLDLKNTKFYYANLQYTNLRHAKLQNSNLRNANLQGADLQGADLEGANLQGANLDYANLKTANLRGAILIYADLVNAFVDFDESDFVRSVKRAVKPDETKHD